MSHEKDEQLIRRCKAGEQAAFELLVRRYQLLVCSIAYSIVGSAANSEDVGQEAFLTAWKQLGDLRDERQFKSWLSTITRNKARAWLRRRANSMQELEQPTQIPAATEEGKMVDQETADLVWKRLAELPESYREPLILYYRQDQSVAEVADSLAITEAATKQRLARGRAMLKAEVMSTIEQGLRASAPTAAFTLGVMAVITTTSKTAAAATGAATAKMVGSAAKTGAAGAASGTLIGLLGAFIGVFAGWWNAEYQSQRQLIVKQVTIYCIGMTIFAIPFIAMQFGWQPVQSLGRNGYGVAYAIWMLGFMGLNLVWIGTTIWSHKRLEKRERDSGTERLPRYRKAEEEGWKVIGFRWVSKAQWLGVPLIQVAHPDLEIGADPNEVKRQGTARAWIAVGHHAYGRVIAIGHRAVAPLAIGTQACGLVSLGVLSIGVVSAGVVSVAPLAAAVIAIGWIGFGGAIAAGYLAVAPLAFGLKAAKGAMVFSTRFAVGPLAFAPHANDKAAEEFISASPTMSTLDRWLMSLSDHSNQESNLSYWVLGLILALVIGQNLILRARQRRSSKPSPE